MGDFRRQENLYSIPKPSITPQSRDRMIERWEYFDFSPDGSVRFVGKGNNRFYRRKFWDGLFKTNIKEEGKYSILGTKIRIRITTSKGSVDYEGTYSSNELVLNIFSHMNGQKAEGIVYRHGYDITYRRFPF